MAKIIRDFFKRSLTERVWMIENTWCDTCAAADIGMKEPLEYEENGLLYVEDKCLTCGKRVESQISEPDTDTR